MPRQKRDSLPKLRRDRNIAFCEHNGQRYRFGRWNSPEAKEAYKRFRITILEGEAPVSVTKKGAEAILSSPLDTAVTVVELVEDYFTYLENKGVNDKRNAKKPSVIGEFYTPESYARAIVYAIRRANRNGENIEHWTPYQLRHAAATEARKKYGRDGAKALLGHVSGDVTDRYTHEWQLELCERMARERVNPFTDGEK